MSLRDLLDDALDGIRDAFDYVISFEWWGDIWDFLGGLFDGLNEFSYMGLIFAVLVIVLIYFLHPYMLKPFLSHMGKVESVFWGGATYVCSGIIGYLVGKRLFD